MKVLLDSSAIVEGDWHLAGNHAQALLAASDRGDIDLLMPEVVFLEVVRKHRKREEDVLKKLHKVEASLRRLRAPDGSEQKAVEDPEPGYVVRLRSTLGRCGGRFLEFPDVKHSKLIERALDETRPFTNEGKLGYRDALIWECLLAEARSQEAIVFVTKDSDYLSESQSDQLHPDLLGELTSLGIDSGRVTIAKSIAAAVNHIVEPAQGVIDDLSSWLADDAAWRENLIRSATEVAMEEAPYADASALEVGVDTEVEALGAEEVEIELDYLDDFSRIAIVDALPLSGGRFGIEIWADCTAYFDVTLSTWSMNAPDGIPASLSLSANEHTGTAGGASEARLIFEATYEEETSMLSAPQLVRIATVTELDGDPGFSGRRFRSRKRPRPIRWTEIS